MRRPTHQARAIQMSAPTGCYWLRAQVAHDTEVAEEALADQIERIKPWSESAA